MAILFILLLFTSFFSVQSLAQIKYDLYVASDGTAEYTTIQSAVDATKAFSDKRITIHVKNGEYNEKVCVYSWNNLITIKGESVNGTIINYNDYFDKINRGRNSTFNTYTFKVEANDFIAENLTVINSAGPIGQAVALHVEGDRCQFINCRIEGNQDTFYGAGEGCRHYFKNCFISGTVDFIFGEATVVFDECEIHSLTKAYITAASTPKGLKYGFVFLNCKLTAAPGVQNVLLGRTWRPYANVVFMNCEMGNHIDLKGWDNWSNEANEKTAFYAEYNNNGPGANTSNRVKWSKSLSKKEAKKYTVKNIFDLSINSHDKLNMWIPSFFK